MVSDYLSNIDEALAVLTRVQMRLSGVQSALATCSFGSWEGQAAQAAREERLHIVSEMGAMNESLNAAEMDFEECRNMLVSSAVTAF